MSVHRRVLAACAIGGCLLAAAGCTGPYVLGRPVPPRESVEVRAEMASVLLSAGRYDEAVQEYRRLLAVDPGNSGYRLALARALAWSGHHGESEAHLRMLAARRPGDGAVQALLREVRANLTPGAAQAERWVAERPEYRPYRLALARAFVREGRAPLALVHYDALLAADPSDDLLHEAVAAYAAARDRRGAIALLQRHLRANPRDLEMRRQLVSLLARGGEFTAALTQIDIGLQFERSPLLLVDRARIHLRRDDEEAAEADLRLALETAATTEAYLALGDLQRWRFDFANARLSYQYAGALSPGDPAVAAALAQLARDERPPLAGGDVPGEAAGWATRFSIVHDNGGIAYGRLGGLRGVRLPMGFTGTAAVEYRHLRERTADAVQDSRGVAGELGLARSFSHGPLSLAIGARAGLVQHFGEDLLPLTAAALRGGYHAWSATIEVAEGPAYPTLLTVASLTGAGDTRGPLRERTVTLTAGGPIGAADAAVVWHRSDLSDGNERSGMNVLARYPLAPRLAVVYSGTSTSYARRSELYWDPEAYLASAVGIELAERRGRGLSYALRVLPGMAHAEEAPFVRTPVGDDAPARLRLQWAASADLGYRGERWDIAAAVGFGRVSLYQRTDAAITLRLQP